LKKELKIPVAGNGDISSAEELVRRAGGGLCDAVMVGRGAVRCPWIFAAARGIGNREQGVGNGERPPLPTPHSPLPTPQYIEEVGGRFLELLALYQPGEFHVSRALRFFSFFCDNLKWGNYLKTRLNREGTLSGIERVWRDYFTENEK
jgi:tRNA-dihydrouridine synthase